MRRIAIVALLTLAAFGAGCGGDSDSGEAEAVVKDYLTALADGDGGRACDLLTGSAQRELAASIYETLPEFGFLNCPETIEKLGGLMGADEQAILRDAEISEVDIEGDTATVTIDGAKVSPELVHFDGGWLVDNGGFGE